ncbi:MAG: maltose O-acetyltransferase [Candidatus Methanomethylophilaceae archaeon]|nr:maltose O-acetyltransferase [Candidatus Methanomethylophilaceae archaeon]
MQNDFAPNSFFGRIYAGRELSSEDPDYQEFTDALERARCICDEYNEPRRRTPEERREILGRLFTDEIDPDTMINPPFRCDVGFNIVLGRQVLINCNCTFLDSNHIIIGDFVMIGPNVTIITPDHSRDPARRRAVGTVSKPVTIESDAWIGAGSIILPGVKIGKASIVGAGSVVTRDVPPGTTVAGNPARPIGVR